MSAIEMVRRGVTAAMMVPEAEDFGDYAGSEVVTLAADRGLDKDGPSYNIHSSIMNHAAIADIVSVMIRKPDAKPWLPVAGPPGWESSTAIDPEGRYLRRFIPVSNWNPERLRHEVRAYHTLGEVCMLRLPMQLVVAELGPLNSGRRHNAWAKGLLHPNHSSLRFKPRPRSRIDGFKESWLKVFREEHDEIPRDTWISGMIEDDIMRELLFVQTIPMPGAIEAQRIRDLIASKLDQALKPLFLPEKKLSVCDGPLSPCPFRDCCWGETETVPTPGIFDVVDEGAVPTL